MTFIDFESNDRHYLGRRLVGWWLLILITSSRCLPAASCGYFVVFTVEGIMSKNWFEDYQQQWLDTWKNSFDSIKDLSNTSEAMTKALDFQQETVNGTLKIQQEALETIATVQKQWWDSYFDWAKQIPLVTNK
ncbi:hypothetical protein ACOKW7_29255 [Limnospira platensis CENA597]|uniref:hypothetical protein n=1 Tax=Oscillatoriales TaxID=1150 RepID=UPI00396F631A